MRKIVVLAAAGLSLALVAFKPESRGQLVEGVVVEEIPERTALAVAGLQPGDVLYSWERPTRGFLAKIHRGTFRSIVDWLWVEKEQSPKGSMVLIGERAGESRRWPIPPGEWLGRITPKWTPSERGAYIEGQLELRAGKVASGLEHLAELAFGAADSSRSWWLHREMARIKKEIGANQEALAILQAALDEPEDSWRKALLYEDQALIHHSIGDFDSAERLHGQAYSIRRGLRDGLSAAVSLSYLGSIHQQQGRLAQALVMRRNELRIHQRLAPSGQPLIQSLVNLALVESELGRLGRTDSLLEEAVRLQGQLTTDGRHSVPIMSNAASLYYAKGDLNKAEELYRMALREQERLDSDSIAAAVLLNNLGLVADQRGNLGAAREFYNQSLNIASRYPSELQRVADTQDNLGWIALQLGELDLAEKYFLSALDIFGETASLREVQVLGSIGSVYLERQQYAQAIDVFEDALRREASDPDRQKAALLTGLGLAQLRSGQVDLALNSYGWVRRFFESRAPGSIAHGNALNNLAATIIASGDFHKAIGFLEEALEIHRRLAPGSIYEAEAESLLGDCRSSLGDADGAMVAYRRAVSAIERQVGRLASLASFRVDFRSRYSSYYKKYIFSLIDGGRMSEAFGAQESFRARSLARLLSERDLYLDQGLPAELVAERERLARLYGRKSRELLSSSRQQALYLELAGLESAYDELLAETRSQMPAIGADEPVVYDGSPAAALDEGTALLSYVVGHGRSVVFLSSSDGELWLVDLEIGEEDLAPEVQLLLEMIRDSAASDGDSSGQQDRLDRVARRLYSWLLAPLEDQLNRFERIAIMPDGPLHSMPWAVLRRKGKEGQWQYLVEWKALHRIQTLGAAKTARSTRTAPVTAPYLVAFGYEGEAGDLERVNVEIGSIATLDPEHSRIFLGSQATEENIKKLSGVIRILHLATHGIYEHRRPLDSALMFHPGEEASGGSENGLLQVWEIFEQMQLNADLVTLSACETGKVGAVAGEGLAGLAGAFLYAGARSVVASLWKVEDVSTSIFMELFYDGIDLGLSKDQALRDAQLQFIDGNVEIDGAAPSPYQWAAFELFGDWQQWAGIDARR